MIVMTVTLDLWPALTIAGGVLAATVIALLWIDRRFSLLVTIVTYEKKHEDLERRMRALELWAAKKNGINPG
jgi:hypothetical protein